MSWYVDITMMLRHISLFTGKRDRPKDQSMFLLGGSVASANAGSESMIMFTHSRGTCEREFLVPAHAEMKTRLTATIVDDALELQDADAQEDVAVPEHGFGHGLDVIVQNDDVARFSTAISVPAMPSANPTSASFSAAASFVPSPVTDTTSPRLFCRLHSGPLVRRGRAREHADLGRHRLLFARSSCGTRGLPGPDLRPPRRGFPGSLRDRLRRQDVVAGDHAHDDARPRRATGEPPPPFPGGWGL